MNDFFAEIEEVFGYVYLNAFSDELYDNNIYSNLGIVLTITSLLWMFIYYYVINHPRYSNLISWIIWILIGGLVNFILTYSISYNLLSELYYNSEKKMDYTNEFSILSSINFGWSLIFTFIFSILIKAKSSNASQTPF
jgi:hypothetical protein